MAKAPRGIMGAFSGKAGTVVGYELNGQALMRALPRESSKPPTEKAINNRAKVKLLSSFLSKMSGFLKMSFTPESHGTTKNWYNLAVQHNNPQAIKGTYPNLEIDYAKAVLSKGDLLQPENARAERGDEGVKLSWDAVKNSEYSRDQTMILVYFPGDHRSVHALGGAKREEGKDMITIEAKYLNREMEVFISFVSNNRQKFSDSLYVGRIEAVKVKKSVSKKELTAAKLSADIALTDENSNQESIIRNKALLDVARNLKALGKLSNIEIAGITGLSTEEIEKAL